MCESLRYAIPLAIAAVCLGTTLSTETLAQGAAGTQINQGYVRAENLIRQARGLGGALDEAPCHWIRQHRTVEQTQRVLDELWDAMQAASAAGDFKLAADLDDAGEDLADALDYYFEDCGGPHLYPANFRNIVEIAAAAGIIHANLPKRTFLGSEFNNVPHIGLVEPDRDMSGGSFNVSLKFNMGSFLSAPFKFGAYGGTETWSKFSFFHMHATGSEAIGTIDAGAGVQILAPGPLGGASGFAFPAGFPAQGASYSSDISKTGGRFDLGQTLRYSSGVKLDLYGSAGYTRTSFDERFSANIVGLDLVYNSNANVDQYKLRFGVGLNKDCPLPGGPIFNFGGYAEAGPDFSRATGDDRLSLTGFQDSSTSPSASESAFGYRVGLTAGIKTSYGLSLSIEGAYMRETGLPVFERDGNNPTTLELESGDVWTVMGRGTLRF